MKFILPLCLLVATPALAQGVVVNEVLASNDATLADPDLGEFSDWLELHNTSAEAVDLGGYFLTDDLDDPTAWRVPDGTVLEAGAYLLIWADDEDPPTPAALHASFKLSADGEAVGLFDSEGALVDSVTFGAQTTDVSYGRLLRAGGWAFFPEPTPGGANASPPGVVLAPTLSLPSGFYSGEEGLVMSTPQEEATIRYTLDGSPPTETSPAYTAPLALTATTVVRAAAFAPGRVPSPVVSHAYFVDEASTLPVISLVTDPGGFFSDEHGIYVEGTNGATGRCSNKPVNWNQDWEREALISFFEPDGAGGHTLAMEQHAGVKIYGRCSRLYPQKSLSLHARGRYGASAFEHRLFPGLDIEVFDDLVLRNSGNDWWRTLFRDGMVQTLTRYMDLDGQAYRPTIVFLNGEYWGIHNLREKLNEDYVAAHYGWDDDDVEMLEGTWSGQSEHYDRLLDVLAGDLNAPEAFAEVEALMDVDHLIEYQIAQIYSANPDWLGNNMKLWRPLTPGGRWRWMLFDTDFSFGGNANGQYDSNTLAFATDPDNPGWPNPPWSTFLFRRLLTNDGFRHAFIQRMAAHTATTFDPERTIRVIDSLQANIAGEISRHRGRWPQPTSDWNAEVDVMREFSQQRPAPMRAHVTDHFEEVDGSARLSLTTTDGGRVYAEGVPMAPLRLDGTPDASGGVFEPVFYRGVPLELVAVPDEGYAFTGWSGLVTSAADTVSVVLTESAALTATFAPVSTAGEGEAPAESALRAAYPNPASRTATVEATLASPGPLSVRVVDMLGREVAVLAEGPQPAGTHRLSLDARRLPSGVYAVVMEAGEFRASRRLVIAR